MEDRAPSAAAEGSVRIGAYSLEVDRLGSFARFEPDEERQNARRLRAALEQEPEERPAVVAAVEDFQESADAVTRRIEQADELLRDAASGKLLDIGNISGEVDALLDLCARLDSEGRFEEELRLMRSLNGLLALSLRWLELIRSLWRLLRSAEAAGDKQAQAFAQHELGSLNLCAGRARAAVDHLERASELESQIGDVAGSCSTRHNLDAARRDLAVRSGPWFRRPKGIQRLVILAGALAIVGGGGAGIALAIQGDGNPGGSGSEATLIVHKDFIPNAPGSVTIAVICTNGGRPDGSPKTAMEAAPAVFKVTGLAAGATCTASEGTAPAGYSKVQADCRDVSIGPGETRSCTIINHRKGLTTATLTVHKDFTPDATESSAEVTVTCTKGGRPDERQKRVTEATPVDFTITRFGKGATCTATESQTPSGYSQNNADCRNVPIAPGSSARCAIANRRGSSTRVSFDVSKDFSDDSSGKVSIGLSCDSGVVSKTPVGAAEGSPATFTITGFLVGATCTATEGTPPSGYTADESDCRRVPIDRGGCTIVDTFNTTTLTVRKEFTDGSTRAVSVSLSCTSGTIDDPKQAASPLRPAVFTVSGFVQGVTCDVTEEHLPSSYDGDVSDCQGVPLVSRGECTIVNSPVGATG
jgi:Domain of unknown function (DUF5979)